MNPTPRRQTTSKTSAAAFWRRFAKSYWEQKPLLLKNFSSPLSDLSHQQIFEMLVTYSDRCRRSKSTEGFKLFVHGERQFDQEILQILPTKADGSLANYHLRLEAVYSDYCLVCDDLLKVSTKHFNSLLEFTENLYRHVGFPNRFAELGLYLGNYRKTPFGVHVDGCGVFSFPVVGRKTFRLWTPEFADAHPALQRADNYRSFKKNSLLLEAEPHDMTYWPSTAWHIAESKGTFSATWSLGVWVDKTHLEVTEEALRPLLYKKLQLPGGGAQKTVTASSPLQKKGQGQIQKLPRSYIKTLQALKKITPEELELALASTWLTHRSMMGFKTIPQVAPRPTPLKLQDTIQLRPGLIIFWRQYPKTTLFACGGVLVDQATSPQFLKLIQALNAGRACRLREFLTGSRRTKDLKALQQFAALF